MVGESYASKVDLYDILSRTSNEGKESKVKVNTYINLKT